MDITLDNSNTRFTPDRPLSNLWECEDDCGDIDCEECRMKRKITLVKSGSDLINYYFPENNRVSVRHGPAVGNEGIMRTIEIAASCVRCGAFILQSQWDNHINWHTNAVR